MNCGLKGNTLSITGDFTMMGVTKPLTLEVQNFSFEETPKGTARFQILGSDFGLEPYSAMFSAIKNLDELTFFIKW